MVEHTNNTVVCSGCNTRVWSAIYGSKDFRCECGAFSKVGDEIRADKPLLVRDASQVAGSSS